MNREIIISCNVLTMDKFIKCLVKDKKKCLVIEGEFTDQEIEDVWSDIFMDYLELFNSNKTKLLAKLTNDIRINEAKLDILNICIMVLSQKNEVISDESYNTCFEILRKYGYKYDFDKVDTEKRLIDLRSVSNTAKMAMINLKRDRMNRNKMLEEKHNKALCESDFGKIFLNLNVRLKCGFKITPQNTTVSEYCSMIKMISNG
jgi:hypothetical protein